MAEAYQQNIASSPIPFESEKSQHKAANVISMIDAEHLLIQPILPTFSDLSTNGLLLLSVSLANQTLISERLYTAWQDGEVISQPLLLPVRFKLVPEMLDIAQQVSTLLNRLGFTYKFQSQFVIVSQVPAAFRHAPIATILPKLFESLGSDIYQANDHESNDNVDNEEKVKSICEQLSHLLMLNDAAKVLSLSEVEILLKSLATLSVGQLQHCFKQPDLSLLLEGIQ